MTPIRGRLFGPGLDGGGLEVDARWLGEALECLAAGAPLSLRCDGVHASGFNHARLRLDLVPADGGPARYSLFVDDPAARAALLAGAPVGWQAPLQRAVQTGGRVERRFRLLVGFALIVTLLPVAALILLWQHSDRLVGWVVERVPSAQEAQLGELVLAQSRARWTLRDRGPAAEAVRQIGSKLTAGSPYAYRWFLADSPEVNAFAAPGGVVVVFAGLVRQADSAEELAGVLAHEVAHVELRHSLQAAVKGLGLRAALGLLFGDGTGGLLADAAADLTTLKFSRDAEREADAEGLRRLLAARIDPQGMLRFFGRIERAQGDATPPAWLSTHPPAAERQAALAAMLAARQPGAGGTAGDGVPIGDTAPLPLTIDWGAVQRALAAPSAPPPTH